MLKLKSIRSCLAIALCLLILLPHGVSGDHVVSPEDLRKEIVQTSLVRETNLETVKQLLTSPPGQMALKQIKADSSEVLAALPQLSNEELAELAARANVAQTNIVAGYHSHDLIYLLIVVLIVIAIVVVVTAAVD